MTSFCVQCGCDLNDSNRAQWKDHCEPCETKVFEFYGATEPRGRDAWTCAHCGTGIVYQLPAMCPECERTLVEEVARAKK